MAYGCFIDLTRRTVCDKTLHDKIFNIAKNPGFEGYERSIALMVYTFFDKKNAGRAIKNKIMANKELPEQLNKQIFRKLKKLKIHSSFIHSIWSVDPADMQLIINIFSKYTWLLL